MMKDKNESTIRKPTESTKSAQKWRKTTVHKPVEKTSKTPFYLFLIVFFTTTTNQHEPIPLHIRRHFLDF